MLLWSTNAYEIESSVRISLHGTLQMISTKRLSNKKNYNGRSSVDLLLVYTKILQNNSPLWLHFKSRCYGKIFDLVKPVTDWWSYECVYIWVRFFVYFNFINANIRIVYVYVSPGLTPVLQRRRHFFTLTVTETVNMDKTPLSLHRLWLLELFTVLLVQSCTAH